MSTESRGAAGRASLALRNILSPDLLLYAGALAVSFHLLVVGYEEPRLRARFGGEYDGYRQAVARWVTRSPRPAG